MNIVDSKFLISCERYSQTCEYEFCEIVFLGRSNVGKSSLINALANRNGLAKSSSTPGKTQLINFFEVTFADKNKLIFVDLPGFGYAKVSKAKKYDWNKNLSEFLQKRKQIKCFIHLIDSRHTNLEIDENLYNYLNQFITDEQEYIRIFTKIDKLNQSELVKLKAKFKSGIFVSNVNKKGIEQLLEKLHDYAK
ncbi:ribosome biogenesis GTP-binding protein YihA/YsxC [Campylobacter sp. MG1]|uniref:ribosome biogenesis GTP-binding protein YihA/YsxC n=1 Tax=Campylobacter sp. MG1 TaxID=2976332 RepID=UPI00226D11C2|nr:ribosome biogenesis GTP-binding protein YihA/YsxC [Campylobacter sp. MG1]